MDLPIEILLSILNYLPPRRVAAIIGNNPIFWRGYFSANLRPFYIYRIDYKEYYKQWKELVESGYDLRKFIKIETDLDSRLYLAAMRYNYNVETGQDKYLVLRTHYQLSDLTSL